LACKGAWTPAAFVPATLELELQPECAEPALDCDARERRALAASAGQYTIAPYALDLPTGWLHVKAVVNGQSPAHRVESAPLAVTVDPAVRVVLEVLGCDADCASPDAWTVRPRDEAGFLLKWRHNPTGTGPLGPTERLRLRLDGAEADAVVAWDVHLARAFEVWDGGPAQTCRDADADEYYRTVVEAPNLLAVADLDTPTLDFEVEPDVASSLPPAFDPGCGVRGTGRGGKLRPNQPYVLEARAWYKGRVIEANFSQTVSEVIVQEYWDHKPFDVPNPTYDGPDGPVTLDAPDGILSANRMPLPADVHQTVGVSDVFDQYTGCLDIDSPEASCLGVVLSGNYHDDVDHGNGDATPQSLGNAADLAVRVRARLEQSGYAWPIRISSGWRNPEMNEAYGFPLLTGHEWGSGVDLLLPENRLAKYDGTPETEMAFVNWCIVAVGSATIGVSAVLDSDWPNFTAQVENSQAPDGTRFYVVLTSSNVGGSTVLQDCVENASRAAERCRATTGRWDGCSPDHVHLSEAEWWNQ
jgi:hypothetical protein